MNDRGSRIVLAICTVASAINLAYHVASASPRAAIGLSIILVALMSSLTVCQCLFKEHPPGMAPDDPQRAGPYHVATYWRDIDVNRYLSGWTGWADSPADAKRRAVDALGADYDQVDGVYAEVTAGPEDHEGQFNPIECVEAGAHGRLLDASGHCAYCGYLPPGAT